MFCATGDVTFNNNPVPVDKDGNFMTPATANDFNSFTSTLTAMTTVCDKSAMAEVEVEFCCD